VYCLTQTMIDDFVIMAAMKTTFVQTV
jgi:hypothetical protein